MYLPLQFTKQTVLNLILTTALGRHCHIHCMDRETEAHQGPTAILWAVSSSSGSQYRAPYCDLLSSLKAVFGLLSKQKGLPFYLELSFALGHDEGPLSWSSTSATVPLLYLMSTFLVFFLSHHSGSWAGDRLGGTGRCQEGWGSGLCCWLAGYYQGGQVWGIKV